MIKNNKTAIILLILLISIGQLNCHLVVNAETSSDQSNNYDSDWVVTGTENVKNREIILNGNLTIKNGGRLTLRNTTLRMNCSMNGSYHIEVQTGGSLFIYDIDNDPNTIHDSSIITTNKSTNNNSFSFWVCSGAVFEMKNSKLQNCGYKHSEEKNEGIFIESDNSVTVWPCHLI